MVQTGECSGSSVCFLPFSLLLLLTRSCLFIAIRAPTNNNLLVNLNHGGFRKWVTKCVSCCLSQEQIDSCIQLWVLFYLLGYAGTFYFKFSYKLASAQTSCLIHWFQPQMVYPNWSKLLMVCIHTWHIMTSYLNQIFPLRTPYSCLTMIILLHYPHLWAIFPDLPPSPKSKLPMTPEPCSVCLLRISW